MENFKLIYNLSDKSKNYVQDQLNKHGAVCFWQEFKKHGYLSQWFSGANANTDNAGSNKNPQFAGIDLFDKRPANVNKTFSFYNCEQYMMFQKASLFKDDKIKQKIIQEINPKNIKKLGREVKNFNNETWNRYKEFIVRDACYRYATHFLEIITQYRPCYVEYIFKSCDSSPYLTG